MCLKNTFILFIFDLTGELENKMKARVQSSFRFVEYYI